MDALTIAYFSLCVTALSGMVLFFGYTFRARRAHLQTVYPLVAVRLHIVLVAVNFVLLSIAFRATTITYGMSPFHHFSYFLFACAYALFFITFLSGLYFHIRFDLRKMNLQSAFLVSHWVLAVFTFILLTSSVALYQINFFANAGLHSHTEYRWLSPVQVLHREMRDRYVQSHHIKAQ